MKDQPKTASKAAKAQAEIKDAAAKGAEAAARGRQAIKDMAAALGVSN